MEVAELLALLCHEAIAIVEEALVRRAPLQARNSLTEHPRVIQYGGFTAPAPYTLGTRRATSPTSGLPTMTTGMPRWKKHGSYPKRSVCRDGPSSTICQTHANFFMPGTGLNDSGLGTITQVFDSEEVQFALKLLF